MLKQTVLVVSQNKSLLLPRFRVVSEARGFPRASMVSGGLDRNVLMKRDKTVCRLFVTVLRDTTVISLLKLALERQYARADSFLPKRGNYMHPHNSIAEFEI